MISKLKQWIDRHYFVVYTLLFIILCFVVFSPFLFSNKTLVWYYDGLNQHYKSYVYYSRYLKNILSSFSQGHFVIPQWEFHLSEGSDIIQTLHYYCIGDPFAALSVFVPETYLPIAFQFTSLLRLYVAGLSFSYLCFYKKVSNKVGILMGSMAYVFCYWNVFSAVRHPYFINPMIFFPLIIVGIEKIIHHENAKILTIAVFLSAISNFYFFYIIVLMTILYVMIRGILYYKTNIKELCITIGKIFGYSLLGTLLAAVLVLPVIYAFMISPRLGDNHSVELFYPLKYYTFFLSDIVSGGHYKWMCMGYTVICIPCIILLCKRHKNSLLIPMILGCVILSMFPIFGKVLNGFSYVSNRWSWAFALVISYTIAYVWDDIKTLTNKERLIILLVGSSIAILSALSQGYINYLIYLQLVLLLVWIILMHFKKRQLITVIVVIVSILNMTFSKFSFENYIAQTVDYEALSHVTENETTGLKEITNEKNMKYTGYSLPHNNSLLSDYSETQFYWTISSPYITTYRKDLEITEALYTQPHRYKGYDDREILMSLSSVQYYISENKKTRLYGHQLLKESPYYYYQNNNALPVGYTYSHSISYDEWKALDSLTRQETLLRSVVTDKSIDTKTLNIHKKLPHTVSSTQGLEIDGSTILVKEKDAKMTLDFKGKKKQETYVCLKGLTYTQLPSDDPFDAPVEIAKIIVDGKYIDYFTDAYEWGQDQHDYTLNLRYSDKARKSIDIVFTKPGIYHIDDISIYNEDVSKMEKYIKRLSKDSLYFVNYSTNCFEGDISLEKKKILCLTVPYSKGWEAYVDGKKTDIFQANVAYMGLELEPGKHHIALYYHTPFLLEGSIVSVISLCLFIVLCIMQRKKKVNQDE